jgi:uncharacterized protein (DUF362 family)
MSKVSVVRIADYQHGVFQALDQIDAGRVLAGQKKVIIKPNLVSSTPPPVTTDVRLVKSLVAYIKEKSKADIIIAEGSGGCDTDKAYERLGYNQLAAMGVNLIDLDSETSIIKLHSDLPLLKEIYLPSIILDGFLISAPCLKQHTLTGVTLGIKNMVGILPRSHYHGFWVFRKSRVHRYNVHQATADICFYRPIDLTVIDGGIGLNKGHLFGKPFVPPKSVIIAGFDPLETDSEGARILGKDPKKIKHLRCYRNNLGRH